MVDLNKNVNRTHLVTCIGVDFDRDYIPHFIGYYKKFGINSFGFILQTNLNDENALSLARRAILSILPDANFLEWKGEFYPEAKAEKINSFIKNNLGDWHLIVDVDEFVEFHDVSLKKTLESSDTSVFFGKFQDRAASDSKPKRLVEGVDIFSQFPVDVDYSSEIGVLPLKPILFKDQLLGTRLHETDKYNVADIKQKNLPVLKIYHFKWTLSTKEKLQRRKTEYKKRGRGWFVESEKALHNYYEPGPIDSLIFNFIQFRRKCRNYLRRFEKFIKELF